MTLVLQEVHQDTYHENPRNPVIEDTTSSFCERAFCVVWDEMKAKMNALWLSEEDLINYLYENNIWGYLKFVDRYFDELMTIKKSLWEENIKIVWRLGDNPSKEAIDEYLEIAIQDTKRDLINLIMTHDELSILFSHFPKEWVKVIVSCIEKNLVFDLIRALRNWIEKYNFSWDLLIEFFEKVPREIYTSIIDQENKIRSINLLIEVYLVLSDSIKQQTLFDDLIKISLSTWKKNIWRLLVTLEYANNEYKEYISDNYEIVIYFLVLAWQNSNILLNSPNLLWKTVRFIKKNNKQKDLILSWLEKLWSDFIYVLDSNSWFIENILERFPERFVEFCENLKKLADYSGNNDNFYGKALDSITQFIVDHPDKWNYLLKIWEIFGKNSPWVLSIWNNFINELLKYFPEKYEEILLEARDIWEHIHGENEWRFLTLWLKFLAKFLEEWKEKFYEAMNELKRLNNDELKHNNAMKHNTGWVFFEYWLDFVSRFIMHSPDAKNGKWVEFWGKVIKVINKYGKNRDENGENFFRSYMLSFNQYIWYQIIDEDLQLLNELLNFLEKVWWSKDALKMIRSLKDYNYDDEIFKKDLNDEDFKIIRSLKDLNKNTISFTLAYLLKYKKSKIIPFIQNFNLIKDLNLWININSVLLGWVSLEYKFNEELKGLFAGENAENTKIWKYFIKIWWQNHPKLEEMKVWITSIIPKKWKSFNKSKVIPTLVKIQNVFAEVLLGYFEKIIHQKIHLKFKKEFGLSKDFDDSLLNENLFEVYKMYSSTRINKQHAFELIQKYLNWEVYRWNWNISEIYPYNRAENMAFLEETLGNKSSIWLSRNEKIYDIEEVNDSEEKTDNIPERIAHHLKVANEKLKLLEIKDEKWNQVEFKPHWKLIDYFDTKLKKNKEKYDTSLFSDLELQINAIKKMLKESKVKKVSKIKIYHELEPLKIAMMWNWVDNSCLSYYSTVWNYYSAITNALEVNKWVFYIEDEHGNVIARVLVWIDNVWRIEVHPMYFKWNVWINLQKCFDKYIDDLIEKIWIKRQPKGIEWGRYWVKLLFCDDWYSWD